MKSTCFAEIKVTTGSPASLSVDAHSVSVIARLARALIIGMRLEHCRPSSRLLWRCSRILAHDITGQPAPLPLIVPEQLWHDGSADPGH